MRISDWSSDVCSSDLSDTLRYSCGIPAQSLAYKLGDEEIMRMRLQVHERLRDKFSFRDFHSAVLGCGTLPLPALEWHLNKVLPRDGVAPIRETDRSREDEYHESSRRS